jgi:hypothetical protein
MIQRNSRRFVLAMTMLLSTISAHAAVPSKQASGALSLSPAVVTLRGQFGQSTRQTLVLTNGTSEDFQFDLVAQDVVVKNGKRVFVDAGTIPGSIAATAVFSQKSVRVPSRGRASVDVTVTLTPDTKCRAIVAIFRATNRITGGAVPMYASIGTLLTFSLSDNVVLDAAAVKVTPQSSAANASFAQVCTNSGSEPFVAKGVVAILDATGTLVGKAAMQPRRLLPEERVELRTEYSGDLKAGHYRVLMTYDADGKSFTHSTTMDVR